MTDHKRNQVDVVAVTPDTFHSPPDKHLSNLASTQLIPFAGGGSTSEPYASSLPPATLPLDCLPLRRRSAAESLIRLVLSPSSFGATLPLLPHARQISAHVALGTSHQAVVLHVAEMEGK